MKRRVYIDAGPIAEPNRSGVGHSAYRTVLELVRDQKFTEDHEIYLIVAFNRVHLIDQELLDKTKIIRVFVPGRIMNGLVRFNMMPPVDLFFGKGVYLFFNFKNWPLIRSRSITYVHDVYFKRRPDHIEPRNLDLLSRNLDRFIARTDIVATVSKHAKKEIEHFFDVDKKKVRVVYNGIETEEFYPRNQEEQDRVAKKYGLQRRQYFMYLSNLEPRKNVGSLLDAYKLLADKLGKGSAPALILVGGMGWKNEAMVQQITSMQELSYRVVRPSSYVPNDDLPALLSGSIALVNPALYEGFGFSPLQALACGRPVVIGNNSSMPEIMGGEFANYADIMDPENICQHMMKAMKTPRISKYLADRPKLFTWKGAKDTLISYIKELEV